MKRIFLRSLVVIIIMAMVFSPYLLVLDFERYSPLVLTIWFVSLVYYLFIKKRVEWRMKQDEIRNTENKGTENPKNKK